MNKRLSILTTAALLLSTAGVIFISCSKDDDPTPDPVMVATSIEFVSGNEQTAAILATLANPVVILVKDQNGDAFAGTTVSFTVSEGSVSEATVTTDANGNASVLWTLGGTIGTQTLNATVEDLTGSPLVFSATGNQITVTDIDGNIYNAVVIGDQVWMAENLKTTHYANGTEIQLVENTTDWNNLGYTDKIMCYYDNSTTNRDTYGALYNWVAAMNGAASSSTNPSNIQGACPDGWHFPSDAEWMELVNYLGGESLAGGKLKETGTAHWSSSNTGATNESGFTALPAGYMSANFSKLSIATGFWSATEGAATHAWNGWLGFDYSDMYWNNNSKNHGFSVRCVKD